ncbi:putative geraniol dehydrogenase (NADP(+)) [Helianthus annuus]|uniref:Geraniol dehydrogenase (NADP(+)) n=1 Tax=Helianthus annuus TaxID=4232 RepID=A0A9K3EGP2_HELAN|nr:putative geraniol dehydrogenase (NADP(+)) [Helianthus annuus]KAJ0670517.1 putative geraniol dehydrogenase (NADP(+)) [Helianthus annuus]
MEAFRGTLDDIIDTVSANHPIAPLLNALTPHGKLVLVGAPEKPLEWCFDLVECDCGGDGGGWRRVMVGGG